jgi:hypothetical protein
MGINITGNIGFLLLAIWLIIIPGICTVFAVGHPVLHVVMGVVALISGICILLGK